MRLLFIASEVHPFIRTGGLGDVVGALSKELAKNGENDVRVILPKYTIIDEELKRKIQHIKYIFINVGYKNVYCGIETLELDGVKFYFIDNEDYFKREKAYGYNDDNERFAFFSRASLELLKEINWFPEVVNCNDWQTGMIPVLYNLEYKFKEGYEKIKFAYTIHNLLFQGNFNKETLEDCFGYNLEQFYNGKLEFYGGISYMKGGIVYSDKVITVSNTYANEIKTSEYGERMEGLLSEKGSDLVGILNGIDYEEYNPKNDKFLYENYNANTIDKKKLNKEGLQKELWLESNKDIPVIAVVSRLSWQKGIDLVKESMDWLLSQNVQIILLGNGEVEYENYFRELENNNRDKVRSLIMFNNEMAHKVYAAADMFLMPSKFEPCGLGQLIALRYGAVPIVRETGGLKDTIEAYDKYKELGNGFSFQNYSSLELRDCIWKALRVYNKKEKWVNLVEKCMMNDNSWSNSSLKYMGIYKEIR
ncbi:glycogen synthase GlgA [uncultured Clostridium sp.]|uniref:glycogen synthase GlgA n=1 Tax=uncultured Clostridium sp. TaxID=59620 RepID=UPI0026249071|nr:glycogen synthase GlgA [uncultured Clostridium sp.]